MTLPVLFSGLASESAASLAVTGLPVVPFHAPRTECHPSLSRCSGRLPSPAGNPSRFPCWS